jgi:hypothetical protein
MTHAIIIRQAGFEQEIAPELAAMREHFVVRESLDQVQPGDELLARFALRPFYADQEEEIIRRGAKLVVGSSAHAYIEDLGVWYEDFADLTPRTWLSVQQMDADAYTGPVFIKGRTYSRKHDWSTHAFAPSREHVERIAANIRRDALHGADALVFRQFERLRTYDHTRQGMPITCEWRYFLLDGQIASGGYYWASYTDSAPAERVDEQVVDEVARRLAQRGVRWCVADFALTEDGRTILIELNDASMTGLSANDPAVLYARMKAILSSSS